MKKLSSLFVTALITVGVFCQMPQKMSYQAVIRNSSDELVKSSTIGMQISILQGSESGTPIYVETHSTSTNNNGLVTVEIGGGTPVTGTFSGIDWSTGIYFLKTETDPAGGTSYSITGTSQLLSVPYALYAKNADDLMPRMEALEQDVFPAKNGFFTIKIDTDELYFIDLDDSSITMIGNIGLTIEDGFFGMQYIDHKLYLCKGGNLYSYNLSSGTLTHIIQNDLLSWQFSINSLGELYTVRELSGMTQGSMYKIDIISNTATLIGTTGTPSIWGMGFDSENQLWAVDEFYGTYGTMDTTTGKFTQYSAATGFPNFQHTTPDNNGNIYSHHGGTVNGIVKYNISSDLASLMIPLEQGMWLGLAYSNELANSLNDQVTATTEDVDILKAQIEELNGQIEELQVITGMVVKDIDGNIYNTETIGTQVWMAENLKTTKYSNGESIPHVTENTTWAGLASGAYCYYNNDSINFNSTYGALYNFYAVIDNRNLCPSGWHVPTDVEWSSLENYMISNGYNYDGTTTGNKIGKSLASTTLWWPSSFEGAVGNSDFPSYRNSSGFNGFPGGGRSEGGGFSVMGGMGYWWTSYEDFTSNSLAQRLDYNWGELILGAHKKTQGFSVRCIKD